MAHDARIRLLALTFALAILPVPGVLRAEDARLPGVQSTAELADPSMKALRKRMVSGKTLRTADLRALADAGDGLAAFKFAKYLDDRAAEDPGASLSAPIHYYSIAAYTGRDFAVPPLLRLLRSVEDPDEVLGKKRLKGAEDALLATSLRGNAEATLALVVFYSDGIPFGSSPDKARELLLSLSDDGTADAAKAALKLALQAVGPDPARPVDAEAALRLLQIAAAGPDIGTRAMAENLIRLLPPVPSKATGVLQASEEVTQ
jgi:hypothetical protein